MIEGVFDFMLLFVGLRALLKKQKDDDMGRRGKRKKKFNGPNWDKESELLDVVSKENRKKNKKEKDNDDPPKRSFENVKLPPPREAQEGHI